MLISNEIFHSDEYFSSYSEFIKPGGLTSDGMQTQCRQNNLRNMPLMLTSAARVPNSKKIRGPGIQPRWWAFFFFNSTFFVDILSVNIMSHNHIE